jgi:hypothetical protein
MSTIDGLPAHALFVHAIVVLVPLIALLEMLCAFWPAARRRLVWLVLALAAVTLAITPLTISAGNWLFQQEEQPSDILITHANRGQWMLLFSSALFVVALALAVVHWLETRSDRPRKAAAIVVAVLALVVGLSSIVAVVRTGDAGTEAVWGRTG